MTDANPVFGSTSEAPGQKSAYERLGRVAFTKGAHTSEIPSYQVLVGADRLYVKSAHPLKDVPTKIDGFPVECVQHL